METCTFSCGRDHQAVVGELLTHRQEDCPRRPVSTAAQTLPWKFPRCVSVGFEMIRLFWRNNSPVRVWRQYWQLGHACRVLQVTVKALRMVPFWGSMAHWRSQLLGSVVDGTFGATVVTMVVLEVGRFAAWVLLAAGGVTTGGAPVAAPWSVAVVSGFSGGDVASGVDAVLIVYDLDWGWLASAGERKNQHNGATLGVSLNKSQRHS